MDILELIKYNSELLIALIALLPSVLGYMAKKINKYFENIREEKKIKSSDNLGVLFDRIHLILLELLYSFVLIIIIFMIIMFAANYIDELNNINIKIAYMIITVIYIIVSELFNKKIKENYKQLSLNLSNNKKKIKLNKLILLSPRIVLNGLLIIVSWFEIKGNVISATVTTFIITAFFILLIKYFSATVTYDRYSKIKLFFNNSYPVQSYDCKDISITIIDAFIIVKNAKFKIMYNKSIVAKVEYISNPNIENNFRNHLLKRGFIK